MKTNPISPYALMGKFARIVKLWQRIEKRPRKFGIDEALSSSEIHLIEVIGENEPMSVTGLAEAMGITKGAVSQGLKRLEGKELVAKDPDPANLSRSLVQLTARGKVAFYAHVHWHETMDGGFKKYFSELPDEKMVFLDEFLTLVEEFFQRRL